ncbi:MAG: TonB-dependent receptor [Bryobacteraceae bacterium]
MRGVVPHLEQNSIFSYLQDKWQIGSRVTLDIGLRHEVYLPPTPRHPGGFSNYDPQTNTLRLGGIGNIPADTGVQTYWGGFVPRTGISWRINDRTVLRAGYGGSLFTPGAEVKGYYNYPVRQYFLTTERTRTFPQLLANGFPAPLPLVFPQDGII